MLIVACANDARVVPLAPGCELTIGRAAPADLQLSDPSLSRTHAHVRREGNAVAIKDLGSRNGVLVGGRPVDQVVLRAGDTAVLGSVMLSIQVLEAPVHRAAREPQRPQASAGGGPTQPGRVEVIRKSPAMVELQRVVERVAQRTIPVLLLGETGTGKELVARELHDCGPRRGRPFVVVNCAAIPDGLIESTLFGWKRGAFTGADRDRPGAFEQARGGTLFLDEVGELSLPAQAALLRVLDSKRVCAVGDVHEIEVNTRVVAATHRDLCAMHAQGTFRLDLHHRLNALTLQLPALRERREEIPLLAEHFLLRFALESGSAVRHIAPDAMARLTAHDWPGNVRELRNAIERAVALADSVTIGVCDLPAALRGERAQGEEPVVSGPTAGKLGDGLRAELRGFEATLIRSALERTSGSRRDAARLLGLPLRTFERKLAALEGLAARRRGARRVLS
jgi:DNA-binding NtrC family response regulator